MRQENWSEVVEKLLLEADDAAQTLQSFLAEVVAKIYTEVGQTPQTQHLLSVLYDAITFLGLIRRYCVNIKDALKSGKWDEVIANFPTREWLGGLENTLASLEDNEFFRDIAPPYKGSLKEFFAKKVVSGFSLIAHTLEEVGIEGVLDRYLEHAPTEPMTEEELEGEDRIRQPSDEEWEKLGQQLHNLLGALKRVWSERKGATEFLSGIEEDFSNAKKKKDVNALADIYNILHLLEPQIPKECEQLYNETVNLFRLYATIPLRKYLALLFLNEALLK